MATPDNPLDTDTVPHPLDPSPLPDPNIEQDYNIFRPATYQGV